MQMTESRFIDLLNERVMLGDGAMGTEIYQHGVFVNTCFDELNLARPDLIRKVHAAYAAAGADFIETNTFGANRLRLAKFGLVDKVAEINRAAVALAKEAAEESGVLVVGSMGPIGSAAHHSMISEAEAKEAFAEQAQALANAGVDAIVLETFASAEALKLAVTAVAQVVSIPLVAQVAVGAAGGSFPIQNDQLLDPSRFQTVMASIAEMAPVSVIGLNCALGPATMLDCLKLLKAVTDKPVSVQPNAGLPREVDGRSIYMSTPEYMAEYAKRFFENGARVIGGCCGTTPDHIQEMVRAVRAMDRAMVEQRPSRTIEIKAAKQPEAVEPLPLAERSSIGARISSGEPIISIELTPPRGVSLGQVLDKAKRCADAGVHAINIPDGPRASARMSPMAMAAKIQEAADIEAILHVCCRDRNLIGLQSDLMGAQALGIRNALIITGDPPKLGEYPDATAVFDVDAIALTSVVQGLNRGVDIAGNTFNPPLGLTLAVGANPVATDLTREVSRFRRKVAAGAEYAITQPVYDVAMLIDFLSRIEDVKIPIVAGIWPFSSYKNAEFMANEVPGVVVPKALLDRMSQAKTRAAGRRIGIEIAREMVAALTPHVAGFAVSAPFGNVKIPLAVMGLIDMDAT